LGALSYQGTWDASTNTPTLTSSVGTKGYYYVVSVAGSTNLNGITDWLVGDWAVYNGTAWQKVDNTDAVTSVNGFTGAVSLTTTNIAEGTNLYYTDVRARASNSAGTGISYDSATGVITNSAPDQTVALTDGTAIDVTGTYPNFTINNTAPDQIVALTGAGTTTISGTYPNFTITSNDEFDGDVVGPASATDNAVARFDTTTGKLIQNSTVTINDNGTLEAVNGISFDTTPTSAPTAEGSLSWNSSDGTLDLVMKGGNVVQQIGEEQYYTVRNETGLTIANGTPVMANGVTSGSGRITVTPAIANGSIDELRFIGLTTESITNGINGYVTSFGYVRGLDTRGTPYGETWAEGDFIYVSPTTAGYLTNVEPTAPNLKIVVAIVITRNQTSGVLLVRPTAYPHITHLSDVNISSPTSGNLLIYDAPQNRWENADLTASTGISVTNGAGSVTITNTAPDQVVALTGAGTTSISGTYPNFTITSNDSTVGTVTSVSGTGTVNGISLSGTVTSSGNLTLGGALSGVDLTTQVTGTLPIANGGTGQTTASTAFNALNPMTTTGDIIYEASATTAARLPIGTTGQVLTVSGGIPAWTTPSTGASVSVGTSPPVSPAAGDFWWDSESGKLKIYYNDGTSAQWVDAFTGTTAGSSGGGVLMVSGGQGFSTTSTSLVDVPNLTAALTEGTWAYTVDLSFQSTGTAGTRFCMTYTGSFSNIEYTQSGMESTTADGATTRQTTSASLSGTAYGATASTQLYGRMFGTIVVTSAGNLKVQIAKATSGTSTTYPSIMTYYRVA
jgi:hypothetical protein